MRNRSDTLCVAAGWRAGTAVWDTQAECNPLSLADGGAPPPPLLPPPPVIVAPVLKSHSFVSHVPATVMSKRTWYVVFVASGRCGMMTW